MSAPGPGQPPPGVLSFAADGGDVDYSLMLFVSGASPSSARAIRQAQALCEQHLRGHYELTVVDVHQEHELAQLHGVLATPTLMRQSPPPTRMRVGDFSGHVAVLNGLGIGAAADV